MIHVPLYLYGARHIDAVAKLVYLSYCIVGSSEDMKGLLDEQGTKSN